MASKTIAVEIPFQTLLSALDGLAPDEKLVLKKRLEKAGAATWQERFGQSLHQTARKNRNATDVANDVKLAIAEIRSGAKN